jgi:toxin ParE1/3/4
MREITWSALARRDLQGIDHYYRDLSFAYAQAVIEKAVDAGELLRRHPELGPAIERSRLRKWRVADTPYILLYRVTPRIVRIARAIHVARDWQRFL